MTRETVLMIVPYRFSFAGRAAFSAAGEGENDDHEKNIREENQKPDLERE